jgi:plasmid stabilization system protein ParE
MNYHLAVSSGARVDIRSVVVWYQRIDPNLALGFLFEMGATLSRIARYPYRFPLVRGLIRKALLKHFPYCVYYSVDSNEVSIIAVVHQRRQVNTW